jgi:hypothetical protein
MSSSLIFAGNVQVHLFGKNALIPISLDDQLLVSVIGFEESELLVNEQRDQTIRAIKSSLLDGYPHNFLQAFNQQARTEIYYEPNRDSLDIRLYEEEASIDVDIPILWMGVLENNLMPSYEVEWEVLKPIDENNTAFCALVKTQSILSANQLSFVSISERGTLLSK